MSTNAESLSEFKPRSTGTKWCSIPKRYVQAMLGFLALFIVFWMRNSFGAAVFHILESRNAYVDEMKIPWSYRELSISDLTFICGFTVAQIPGALLTFKFSSHRILLISMVLTTILHTLAPFLLSCGSAWIIILRLLQGTAEGPIYPACVGIWKSWAPPSERTRLLCIVLCGSFFGSVAGLPLNTELVNHFGPKGCFFISTTTGLLWCLMWLMHIYESPSSHPYISHHEQSFLEESIDVDNNREITVKSIPWKAMFTSLPVWVVLLASIWYFSSEYFLVNSPSIYYSIESGFENDYTLLDILLPNLIMGAVVLASGFCADYLIKVNLSRSLVRKLFCCGAFTLHGMALLVVRFCKNNEAIVICINLAHGFLGLSLAGFWLNCLDFSPYYATVVMALLQTFGNLCDAILAIYVHPGLYYPLMGAIPRLDAFIAISFIVSLAYAIFGSGDVQSWGKPETMHRRPTEDESQRSTYYSYPEAEDFVEMVGDSQLLLDVHPEYEKERY